MKRVLRSKHFTACCVLALSGCCTQTVTKCWDGSDRPYYKAGIFALDEQFKRDVNGLIALEKAGTLTKAKGQTTKQFWQARYHALRNESAPIWKPSEFKSMEDIVAYIKQQRRAAGLPTYD